MEYVRWEPLYEEILRDFGFPPERDVEAARALERMLPRPEPSLRLLEGFAGKRVAIIGPACAHEELASIASSVRHITAADSAVSVFGDSVAVPAAIVTDLDGDLRKIAHFASLGSVVVVHAHGDNIHLLDNAKGFGEHVLGTCQSKPFGKLFNFGGFTDGDRAAFLAEAFGASSVELIGFDFENPSRKEGGDARVKLRKLAWAKRLLGLVNIPVTAGGRPLV
jgi:uncharacterized Rossmann fold enzyme